MSRSQNHAGPSTTSALMIAAALAMAPTRRAIAAVGALPATFKPLYGNPGHSSQLRRKVAIPANQAEVDVANASLKGTGYQLVQLKGAVTIVDEDNGSRIYKSANIASAIKRIQKNLALKASFKE